MKTIEQCPLCKSPYTVASLKYVLYGHYCHKLKTMLYWNYSEMSTDPEKLMEIKR